MKDEPKNCRTCGEDAFVIGCEGKAMVRVRRTSKCKNYIPPAKWSRGCVDRICRTEIVETIENAVDQWNEKFGVV